eukprot:436339_1
MRPFFAKGILFPKCIGTPCITNQLIFTGSSGIFYNVQGALLLPECNEKSFRSNYCNLYATYDQQDELKLRTPYFIEGVFKRNNYNFVTNFVTNRTAAKITPVDIRFDLPWPEYQGEYQDKYQDKYQDEYQDGELMDFTEFFSDNPLEMWIYTEFIKNAPLVNEKRATYIFSKYKGNIMELLNDSLKDSNEIVNIDRIGPITKDRLNDFVNQTYSTLSFNFRVTSHPPN